MVPRPLGRPTSNYGHGASSSASCPQVNGGSAVSHRVLKLTESITPDKDLEETPARASAFVLEKHGLEVQIVVRVHEPPTLDGVTAGEVRIIEYIHILKIKKRKKSRLN